MEMALKPDATAKIVAPLCAALAAQEHGDARRAIDLLKVSGEIAELRGKVCIEEQDVIDAKEKIEVDRVIEVVKTLPIQSKTALLACIYIFDSGNGNTTNNIYNAYRMLCDAIGIDTLTQRRMTDLLGELDQLGIIEGTIVFQGRYGRKKQITKITSKEHALETLYQDFRLKTIAYIPSNNFFNTSVIRW
jgi:cell division control protein 6